MHLRGRGGADGLAKFLENQEPGPDDNYTFPSERGEAQPMPYLVWSFDSRLLMATTTRNVQ